MIYLGMSYLIYLRASNRTMTLDQEAAGVTLRSFANWVA